MICHIMIESGVNGTGPQTVGDGKQEQNPILRCIGKSQQAHNSQKDRTDHNPFCRQLFDNLGLANAEMIVIKEIVMETYPAYDDGT